MTREEAQKIADEVSLKTAAPTCEVSETEAGDWEGYLTITVISGSIWPAQESIEKGTAWCVVQIPYHICLESKASSILFNATRNILQKVYFPYGEKS